MTGFSGYFDIFSVSTIIWVCKYKQQPKVSVHQSCLRQWEMSAF